MSLLPSFVAEVVSLMTTLAVADFRDCGALVIVAVVVDVVVASVIPKIRRDRLSSSCRLRCRRASLLRFFVTLPHSQRKYTELGAKSNQS